MKHLLALALFFQGSAAQICTTTCDGDVCTFNINVELTAGQWGYFVFDECPGMTSPTIGMEIGKTYRFIQQQVGNYYHPLGFAYFADGAHDDVDELEPVVQPPGTSNGCVDNATCPAPMYLLNDQYLGFYSNDPTITAVTTGEDDFGLDAYEPLFFYPLDQWTELGNFTVSLRFTDQDYTEDIFYFCHIHQFMTGRVKLLKDGVPVNVEDSPALPADYYKLPSEYDQQCGTFGLENFQLPNPFCPDRFVCDAGSEIAQFADCIESMDCHMFNGMTNGVQADSEIALFLHQMIPHHENAVNMAKAILNTGETDCDDILSEDDYKCSMKNLALSIINVQNHQIQSMTGLLESFGYPETDNCEVPVATYSRI